MFGSDPEFFIADKTNTPVPAHLFFPPKEAPFLESSGGETIKMFRDGYALELNIPPRTCRQEFAGRIRAGLHAAQSKLPTGYSLLAIPSIKINLKDLADAPEDVLLFGCDAVADAYSGEDRSVNLNGLTHPYRYAGGHLHYSGTWPWLADRKARDLCVKMLDLYLGVPFTFLFHDLGEFRRRKHYGQAGEYRFQQYPDGTRGIEYRVLSPRVMNHPCLLSLCNGILRHVVTNFVKLRPGWDATIEPKVRRAINTGFRAQELLTTLPTFYTPELLGLAEGAFSVFEMGQKDNYEGWGSWIGQKTGRALAYYTADKAHYLNHPEPHFWY